jgi:hypothetical protein
LRLFSPFQYTDLVSSSTGISVVGYSFDRQHSEAYCCYKTDATATIQWNQQCRADTTEKYASSHAKRTGTVDAPMPKMLNFLLIFHPATNPFDFSDLTSGVTKPSTTATTTTTSAPSIQPQQPQQPQQPKPAAASAQKGGLSFDAFGSLGFKSTSTTQPAPTPMGVASAPTTPASMSMG